MQQVQTNMPKLYSNLKNLKLLAIFALLITTSPNISTSAINVMTLPNSNSSNNSVVQNKSNNYNLQMVTTNTNAQVGQLNRMLSDFDYNSTGNTNIDPSYITGSLRLDSIGTQSRTAYYIKVTCYELKQKGYSNFSISDPNYRQERDLDFNGIACEYR